MRIADRLAELARRDRDHGYDDPAALREHYAMLGVDAVELAVACVAYLRPRGDRVYLNIAVSLAGRMFEAGYLAGLDENVEATP